MSDEQENSEMKRIPQPSKLFYHKVNEGVLYCSKQKIDPNQPLSSNMNGYCRVHFTNSTTLQGVFQQGKSNNALYYGNYIKGWIQGQCSSVQKLISGIGSEYSQRGQLLYKGNFMESKREGMGTEYFSEGNCEGMWIKGNKNGKFKELSNNYSLVGEGEFKNNRKIKVWLYKMGDQVEEKDYKEEGRLKNIKVIQDSNVSNTKILHDLVINKSISENVKNGRIIAQHEIPPEQIRSFSNQTTQANLSIGENQMKQKSRKGSQMLSFQNPYSQQNHFLVLTESSFQKIADPYRMLDDTTLSAWSILLQYYASSARYNNLIIFPIDLMKYYVGVDFKQRRYKSVKHFSKHLTGHFSLFKGVENQTQKVILIPIIRYMHFTLAVVKFKYEEQLKIQCCIWDSFYKRQYRQNINQYVRSSDQTWKAVHDYLQQECKDKFHDQQCKRILKAIQDMELYYEKVPQQPDGVSCGVFVCIFMYYQSIVKPKSVPDRIDASTLRMFRNECLKNLLSKTHVEMSEIQEIQQKLAKWIDPNRSKKFKSISSSMHTMS